MRDRTPTKVLDNGALRYGVYDESGNFLRHEYLALDDAPTDTGTDLSKATLLADETEVSLFGSAADRTVDDAFRGLAGQLKLIMGDMAQITVTLADSAGAAIPGVLVQGILSDSGQAVYSNDSGVVSGYISEGSQTIKVTGYADIEDYSETLTVTKGTAITKAVTLTTRNFLKITSSQSVKFSGNVETVDVTVVGGGGGGGGSYSGYYSGGGGGGGYCTVVESVNVLANNLYNAVIGAGGTAGVSYYGDTSAGGAGGTSSFMNITANGGNGGDAASKNSAGTGGAGNGKGGDGVANNSRDTVAGKNGANGSVYGYSSFDDTVLYGGGGGSGCAAYGIYELLASGGNAYGGSGGGGYYVSNMIDGKNNAPSVTANGGGGGGSGGVARMDNDEGRDYTSYGSPAAGGSGCVAIRMHLKSAA